MSDARFTIGLAAVSGMLAFAAARRVKAPAILLLLATGAVLGPSVLRLVHPESLGRGLGVFVELAVAVILFEGSMSLDPEQFKKHSGPIRNLLTIGAATTFAGATALVHWILGFSFGHALLVGSILIVTGPTVVGPLLRFVRPRPTLAEILRWESILIDPIGALVAVVVLELVIAGGESGIAQAARSYAIAFAAGTTIGVVSGLALARLITEVDEETRSPLALAFAFASFSMADALVDNSGLFAVTVAGLTLAIRRPLGHEDVEHFKGRLTSFMLAILFVLLAGLMDLRAVARFGPRGFTLLGGLLLVRFVSVTLSTLGSGLGLRERAFLTWISPRGVVAAAAASFFSQKLAEHGDPDADEIRTVIFFVIVGTVTIQGLSARLVGGWLGVLAPDPNEVAIVGAGAFGRALARELAAAGALVTLIDKNASKLEGVGGAGLRPVAGDAQSKAIVSQVDPASTAFVIAGTPNDEANALVCAAFASAGVGRVTQIPTGNTAILRRDDHAATSFSFSFGSATSLQDLERAIHSGGRVRRVPVEREQTLAELEASAGGGLAGLVEVRADGAARLVQGSDVPLGAGTTLIGIELSPDETRKIRAADLDRPDARRWLDAALALAAAIIAIVPFARFAWPDVAAPPSEPELDLAALRSLLATTDSVRPLAAILPDVERRLLAPDPAAWNVVGLGLHAISAALVYAIARRLEQRRATSFVAAALFGVAACHAATLRDPNGHGDVLGVLLFLVALAAHVDRGESTGRSILATVLAATALALSFLATNLGVVFVPLAIAVSWTGRQWPKAGSTMLAFRYGAYVLVASGWVAWRRALLGTELLAGFYPGDLGDAPASARVLATLRAIGDGLARIAYAVPRPPIDPFPSRIGAIELVPLGVLAVALALAAIARDRRVTCGLALALLPLLLVANGFVVSVADAHLALPSLGVALLFALLAEKIGRRSPPLEAVTATSLVLGWAFAAALGAGRP